jgi:glutamate-1-semialdehyde 2,1-aminomutase
MHPNGVPPTDSTLLTSHRGTRADRATYTRWLTDLRAVCAARSIPLIFDEVFLGFRLARGGCQEFFGVRADLVTYGKSLGGGLPVGVLCGKRELMRRFRDDCPTDVCLARGTFNAHPYVMTAMNEFLRDVDSEEVRTAYAGLSQRWDTRANALNERLRRAALPVRVDNLTSVWTTRYEIPSRYHWMFQFYLRAEGLHLAWIGSGRFIFAHDLGNDDYLEIERRFVAAAEKMLADGWRWLDGALIHREMERRILIEMVRAGLGRGASDRSAHPS